MDVVLMTVFCILLCVIVIILTGFYVVKLRKENKDLKADLKLLRKETEDEEGN